MNTRKMKRQGNSDTKTGNLRTWPARPIICKKAPKRLEVSKLNQDSMGQAFINDNIFNH